MRLTEDDLDKSVSGVLSRFGIDKDEAKKVRHQLDKRLGKSEEPTEKPQDERFNVCFLNRFGMIDLSVDDILMPTLTVTEQTLYRRFYRLSYCFGKNWCQVSQPELAKSCNISSLMTVRKGVATLVNLHCVKVIEESIQRKPPTYRVYLPCEMPQFSDMDIQTGVVFMKEKPDLKTLRELYNNVPEFNKLNISPLIINTLNDLRQIIFGEQDTEISPLNISTLATKSSNTAIPHSRKNEKDQPINSNINNSFKHTFSQDQVIDLFYNGIEQTKITKQKRERAEVNIKKLLKEGFTLEDIQFAIKWTLENAKEEPYDFSIINHTIGQAMAEKGKAEKKEAENLEKERILAQKQEEEEKQEKLLEKVKEYKNSLDGEQRKQLREGALKAIRSTKGIREEFITEILIEAKENELIYKQAIEE
ncbi:MAG: hypothetical protein FJW56_04940 [Actinobacteria bacterium]|nr:hypothetical protein [Actinomycetota bacterium]